MRRWPDGSDALLEGPALVKQGVARRRRWQAMQVNEVHVWCTALNPGGAVVQDLSGLLAPDERTRAERFRFQRDREHFIAARGQLRRILGGYLGRSPEELRFRYSPYGKPALTEEWDPEEIQFNMSHSHAIVLYAIARGRRVGIDVEWIRPDFATEQIAERFFSAHEVAALRALPAADRPEAFFHCWTRKEAYIKARGEGLSLPLDQFDVSLAPGEPAALLRSRADPDEVARWRMCALTPPPGYAGALVVEGQDWHLRYRPWPDPDAGAAVTENRGRKGRDACGF
jgi:4'-phosphopantetheinyl transferase